MSSLAGTLSVCVWGGAGAECSVTMTQTCMIVNAPSVSPQALVALAKRSHDLRTDSVLHHLID